VLCEKPLASALTDARSCIDHIGEVAARKVFLGFNRRFDRGHLSLREAVHAGEIGRVEQLTITSRDPFPPPLAYVPRSGGLFRDMMIHDFDMARSILRKEFVSVTAHGSAIIDPEVGKLGDIDTASVTLVAEDGTLVSILNSRRCAFGFDQRIEAFGSDGMVISDNPRQSGLKRYSADHPGSLAPILTLFMECAREGRDMPVNAFDGLMAAYLAEATTVSFKQGKTIHLTSVAQEF